MNNDAKLAAVFPMLAESALPIEELDLEVASRNSLRRNGVHTVAQLLQLTHTKLISLFFNRNLPFYSEIISQLTHLAQSPNARNYEYTVESLPDDFFRKNKVKKFNVFQVSGIWKSEEIHTRIIAELLNPNSEFHELGAIFLQKFLARLEPKSDLFSGELEDIKVETEVYTVEKGQRDAKSKERRIDMVIETTHYYLPFEVKIWSGDQKSQLYDYYQYAEKQEKTVPHIYYLTPNGHKPRDWSRKSSTSDDSLDPSRVRTLSFQNDILPWIEDCIKIADDSHHCDILEILKQLRDNIQGYPSETTLCPDRRSVFSSWWQSDILDDIYQELSQQYNLSWTECTDQYITFTLHKRDTLEFALRIKKKAEDCVSLHLICGVIQDDGTPDYAEAGPYIYDHPNDFESLLSETFSDHEKVKDTTAKSVWERMNVILCEKTNDSSSISWAKVCSSKIEEVFSWMNNNIHERWKRNP